MNAPTLPKGFHDAHGFAQEKICDVRGLFTALETVMEDIDVLRTNDPRSNAIWAVMRVLDERIEAADEAVTAIWRAMP